MIYGLIAYKSNGATYSRGCVMDQWGSDFEFYSTTDKEKLINKLTTLILKNLKAQASEEDGEYQFHFQFDGFTVSIEDNVVFDVSDHEYVEKYGDADIKYESEARSMFDTAKERATKLFNDEKESKRLAELESQRKIVEAKEAKERDEFERLKKKFEG